MCSLDDGKSPRSCIVNSLYQVFTLDYEIIFPLIILLFLRFYNTFLREAINNNNLRGIFNLYYQYSTLAKDLSKWCPELLPRVVKYLSVRIHCPSLQNY